MSDINTEVLRDEARMLGHPGEYLKLYGVFDFGKHKGDVIKDVIDNDKSYVDWIVNESIRILDNEAYKYYMSVSSD